MLYTNTLYTGKEIWDYIDSNPNSWFSDCIHRRFCDLLIADVYIPGFNLEDLYWIDSYTSDWFISGVGHTSRTTYRLHRATTFHGGKQKLIIE